LAKTRGADAVEGQLEQCAKPYFSLEAEVDGTPGYRTANDYRRARILRGLYTNPRLLGRLVRSMARHPRVTATMVQCFFIEKSWDWLSMKVTLKFAEKCPRTVPVDSAEFVIGRNADCHLQLESSMVSRRHCALTMQDGRLFVRDLHSRNGTGLNNQVLVGQQQLQHGDLLWVATTSIEVDIRNDA
jgi:hypothetical protein